MFSFYKTFTISNFEVIFLVILNLFVPRFTIFTIYKRSQCICHYIN